MLLRSQAAGPEQLDVMCEEFKPPPPVVQLWLRPPRCPHVCFSFPPSSQVRLFEPAAFSNGYLMLRLNLSVCVVLITGPIESVAPITLPQ